MQLKKYVYSAILIPFYFLLVSFVEGINDKTKIEIYNAHIQRSLDDLQSRFDCLADPIKREEITHLLTQVRLKELASVDQYQVVTAQDSRFFAYQTIAKELYEQLNQIQVKDFEFLRYPSSKLMKSFDEFFNCYPFLKENSTDPLYPDCDVSPEISTQLISASFCMETNTPADSCLFVFLFGKGIGQWMISKQEDLYHELFMRNVAEIFENAGIDKCAYEPYLVQLIEAAPRTNEGIINQIFINKASVDKHLYISLSGGFLDQNQNIDLHEFFSHFQMLRMEPEFNMKEALQARLLAGDLFNGYVSIYRYTLIPEEEQKNYHHFVKDIISQILN